MKDFAISEDPAVQKQLDRLADLPLPQSGLGLEKIHMMLERLGNPERDLPPVFHVAGTNGKGSTCAFLRAILEAEGLTVHVATKPHLVRYNERIRIAGELISDALLASLLEEVLDASEDLAPSFFEVTTAAMFLAFHRNPADACVIEVGLGGRFDATNVLERPAACGIAALGIDHESFLLAEDPSAPPPNPPLVRIAFEKAGIAREGSPLVTQSYSSEVEYRIAQSAAAAEAPLALRGRDWSAVISDSGIAYGDAAGKLSLPLPEMPGAYQADNAALAVAMIRHQDRITVSEAALAEGIRKARWPARLQRLSKGPLTELLPHCDWLLDGGHNLLAAQGIARHWAAQKETPRYAIIGMLEGKDWRGFIETLAPHIAQLVAIPVKGHEHAPTVEMAAFAKTCGISTVGTVPDLFAAAGWLAERADRPGECYGEVFVGGSLYLAGEVLRLNREWPD